MESDLSSNLQLQVLEMTDMLDAQVDLSGMAVVYLFDEARQKSFV